MNAFQKERRLDADLNANGTVRSSENGYVCVPEIGDADSNANIITLTLECAYLKDIRNARARVFSQAFVKVNYSK